MWYLYLDESGDLGFDFVNKKPSKFFTVTILALRTIENNRQLITAVRKTLRRKSKPKKKDKSQIQELKGSKCPFKTKQYFYQQVKDVKFALYSVTLNKRRVYDELAKHKSRVYNWIARQVLEEIPFAKAERRIELVIDKSKRRPEIVEFNRYIQRQLEAQISPKVPLDIYHWSSQENKGLQAVDMFCWGIFQKYERQKTEWYDIFKAKIVFDQQYL